MLGAIAGDVIGSVFEGWPTKSTDFTLFQTNSTFTDDTVLTVAIAHAILLNKDYATAIKEFGLRYPDAGYGGLFVLWLASSTNEPYGSWGNGSAMRVSPVGFAFDTAEHVLEEAERSAAVTHNHPEGIKGAQATALAIFLARTGATKQEIREEITRRFNYDLDRTLDEIRPSYGFDESCQGTVPEAILAVLESESYEEAVRNAISLGGDSDTLACIAGGIAHALYKQVPSHILQEIRNRLPPYLLSVIDQFNTRYHL